MQISKRHRVRKKPFTRPSAGPEPGRPQGADRRRHADGRASWSRRRLLGTAVLAGASLALGAAASSRAQTRSAYGGYPMGVHGASLAAFPTIDAVRMVAHDLGLHRLELTAAQIRLSPVARGPAASLQDVRELRDVLESMNVTPSAYGPVRLAGDERVNRALFVRAQALGVRNVTCIPESGALDDLEGLADEFGVRLAIHNNATGAPFDTIAQVLSAVEGRGANVGACLDIGNALRGSEDPAEAVRRLGSRLIGIHLKDVSARDPDSEVIVIGEGFLDVPAFFGALEEVGFPADGALSLEYLESPDDPLPGLREGLRIASAALSR